MLAKKHQKVSEKMHSSVREPTASSPTTPPQSPLAPEGATPESCVSVAEKAKYVMGRRMGGGGGGGGSL